MTTAAKALTGPGRRPKLDTMTGTVTILLNVHEAAAVLGIAPRTLRRQALEGTVPASKLSGDKGAYVFDPVTIKALAAERAKA